MLSVVDSRLLVFVLYYSAERERERQREREREP